MLQDGDFQEEVDIHHEVVEGGSHQEDPDIRQVEHGNHLVGHDIHRVVGDHRIEPAPINIYLTFFKNKIVPRYNIYV